LPAVWRAGANREDDFMLTKYFDRMRRIGPVNYANYWWHQKTRLPRRGFFQLRAAQVPHPMTCRAGTSDIDVFKEVFVRGDYSWIERMEDIELIIDCGANVGFSASLFAAAFPKAKVIAVEPDPGNFATLKKNVEPFGARCECVQAGVWSKRCGLVFREEVFGDGREWAVSVREARQGEKPAVEALGIADLLAASGYERISLLKIDIEGSEAAVFDGSQRAWIDRTDHIVAELHDEECERRYFSATEEAGFVTEKRGMVAFSWRQRLIPFP
jgi:FkbM family methyltransferase